LSSSSSSEPETLVIKMSLRRRQHLFNGLLLKYDRTNGLIEYNLKRNV